MLIIMISVAILLLAVLLFWLLLQQLHVTRLLKEFNLRLDERDHMQQDMRDYLLKLLQEQHTEQQQQRLAWSEYQLTSLQSLQTSLRQGMAEIRIEVGYTLKQSAEILVNRVDKLTQTTAQNLKDISAQVEKRLSDGFEKTTNIFADVTKRLALIDAAQKHIAELSSNVVSLQEILADKRSRGAFGEVQLAHLVRNVMPESHFTLQYTLANNKRCDCMLFLPEPTGNIAIDAKFPLESYRRMTNAHIANSERQQAEQQFRLDIRRHLQDIASKYIVAGETADGAIMFIPAEAIFAEIHAHYPDLVEEAQQKRVWLASPTTLMAILTTARAVLKDAATRKQVHIIQQHLVELAKDFGRFEKRMDELARHIEKAHQDVDSVKISSQKITSRFQKIEKVEITTIPVN